MSLVEAVLLRRAEEQARAAPMRGPDTRGSKLANRTTWKGITWTPEIDERLRACRPWSGDLAALAEETKISQTSLKKRRFILVGPMRDRLNAGKEWTP